MLTRVAEKVDSFPEEVDNNYFFPNLLDSVKIIIKIISKYWCSFKIVVFLHMKE